MKAVLQALLPLFSLILLGYLVGRLNLLRVKSAKVLNIFVMKIALPTLIFRSISTQPFHTILNGPFLIAFLLTLLIPYLSSFLISRKCRSEPLSESALRALTLSLPNTGYLGIPLLSAIYKGQGGLIASIASFLIVSIIIPTMIICEIEKKGTQKLGSWTILICLKNPLLIAAALGIGFSYLHFPITKTFHKVIQLLGSIADPCALFALGESVVGKSLHKELKGTWGVIITKLFVQPLIALLLLWLLKVEGVWAVAGFLLSALPTGVIVSILVDYYKGYFRRGLSSVLTTTIFSLITLLVASYLASKVWGSACPW